MIDYAQPPPHVHVIQDRAPNCADILKEFREKGPRIDEKLTYVVTNVPVADGIKFFPKADGLEVRARVVNSIDNGVGSIVFLAHRENKYGWDVAVEYSSTTGEPGRLYYARGKAIDKGSNVVHPHDVLFRFYKNPEDISVDKLDINKLSMYVSTIAYTCLTDYPKDYLDKEFKKTQPKNKMQRRNKKDLMMKQRKFTPKNHMYLRQKILR